MHLKDFFAPNQLFALLAKGMDGFKIIVINILIARFYGPEVYGKFAYVIGVVSLVAILAEFRLQSILTRELSIANRGSLPVLLGAAFYINIVFALLGLSLFIAYGMFESDTEVALAAITCSLGYFFKITRFFRAWFISRERNVYVAISEFFASCMTIAIILVAVLGDVSWEYLPIIRSLDYLIVSALFMFFFFKKFDISLSEFRFDLGVAKSLVVKSSPLVLSGVAMLLFQRMDILMIRALLGDESVGYYSAASNFMMLFSLAPMVLSESLGPKLFKGSQSEELSLRNKKKFVWGVMFFGLVLSLSMYLLGIILIPVLFGAEYVSSLSAHLFLSLCPFMVAAGAAAGQLIVSDNTQGKAYIKSVVACGVNFLMNLFLIPVYGIAGAAIATVVGFLVANFIGHWFVGDYRYIFMMQARFFMPLSFKGKLNA